MEKNHQKEPEGIGRGPWVWEIAGGEKKQKGGGGTLWGRGEFAIIERRKGKVFDAGKREVEP